MCAWRTFLFGFPSCKGFGGGKAPQGFVFASIVKIDKIISFHGCNKTTLIAWVKQNEWRFMDETINFHVAWVKQMLNLNLQEF